MAKSLPINFSQTKQILTEKSSPANVQQARKLFTLLIARPKWLRFQ